MLQTRHVKNISKMNDANLHVKNDFEVNKQLIFVPVYLEKHCTWNAKPVP